MLAGGPTVVALSTTEAKYISLSKGTQQAKWVQQFLAEIDHPIPLPVSPHTDNRSALAIAENPKFHSQVKHINTHFHYLQDEVEKNLSVAFIPSEENPADILMKPLGTTVHHHQVELMGMKHCD